jgi:predicted  nucleic acid-binding Zn-ribbon protein
VVPFCDLFACINQKLEQQSRGLHNRSANMKEEIAGMKQRVKALQNDLAKEREQVNELKKHDPVKMKKWTLRRSLHNPRNYDLARSLDTKLHPRRLPQRVNLGLS